MSDHRLSITQTPTEAWLDKWIEKMRVRYSPRDQTVRCNGRLVRLEILFHRLHLDVAAAKLRWLKISLVDEALSLWLAEQAEQARDQLQQQLAYAPDGEQLRPWVRAVTGRDDPVDAAVVAHFLWQVKRKLFGLPVTRHMMPIFVGKQRGGKSTAVRKLIEPIEEAGLVENCHDLRLLEDDRHIKRFATRLIVFADEMGKVRKTDIAMLKNFITQEVPGWRIMRSTETERAPNLSTFIGASNPDVADLIFDPTGMGRFYECRCLDVLDWSTINSINYTRVWRSVDHKAPSPIEAHLPEVSKRQQAITVQHSVDEWLAVRCDLETSAWTNAHSAYEAYAKWMVTQRRVPESETSFGRRLNDLDVRWKRSNGIKYQLKIHDTPATLEYAPPIARA